MTTVVEADFSNSDHATAIVEMIAELARSDQGRRSAMSAEERARLIPTLRDYPALLVLLAQSGTELCGVAVCFMHPSTFSGRPILKLHDLYVVPSQRRMGVGQALVKTAIAAATARGCAFVTVEVASENEAAIGLYRQFGFGDWLTPTRFMELRL